MHQRAKRLSGPNATAVNTNGKKCDRRLDVPGYAHALTFRHQCHGLQELQIATKWAIRSRCHQRQRALRANWSLAQRSRPECVALEQQRRTRSAKRYGYLVRQLIVPQKGYTLAASSVPPEGRNSRDHGIPYPRSQPRWHPRRPRICRGHVKVVLARQSFCFPQHLHITLLRDFHRGVENVEVRVTGRASARRSGRAGSRRRPRGPASGPAAWPAGGGRAT